MTPGEAVGAGGAVGGAVLQKSSHHHGPMAFGLWGHFRVMSQSSESMEFEYSLDSK